MRADCPQQALLADLVLGKLSDTLIDEVVQHASGCPVCAPSLETLDGLSDGLISVVRRHVSAAALGEESEVVELGRLLAQADEFCSESAADSWFGGDTDSERITIAELSDDDRSAVRPHIGQYTLLEKLGQGAMGAVYKARHHKLKRIVALKMLPAHRLRDRQALVRFDREMEAIGKVDHPNVVRATDAGHLDDVPYLVMEYVEGVDLARLVRRLGALPIADACEIVRQTALALDHAHQRGLIHRDVKPSNVMLNDEGQVKLLDLGLARLLELEAAWDAGGDEPSGGESTTVPAAEEATSIGQIIGTRDFMAPEQALDSHDVDARVDIYSLGCTFYKLLTGNAPFAHLNRKDRTIVLKAHATLAPPLLQSARPDAPQGVAQIVELMLAKRPDERFAAAKQVAEELEPYCRGANLQRLSAAAKGQAEVSLVDEKTSPVWAELVTTAQQAAEAAAAPTRRPRRSWTGVIVAAACLTAAAALIAGLTILWRYAPVQLASAKTPSAAADPTRGAALNERSGQQEAAPERAPNDEQAPSDAAKRANSADADASAQPAASAPQPEAGEKQPPADAERRFALRFAGGSQRVEFRETRELVNLTRPFTLEMWHRDSGPSFQQALFGALAAGERSGVSIRPREPLGWMLSLEDHSVGLMTPTFKFSANYEDDFPGGSGFPSRYRALGPSSRRHGIGPSRMMSRGSQWRHIALCFDGTEVTICLDGELLTNTGAPQHWFSSAASRSSRGGDLTLGVGQSATMHIGAMGPTQGLTGDICGLRLSSKVRYVGTYDPPAEFANDEDTLLLVDFSQEEGEEIADLSGHQRHGKIIGAQWVELGPDEQPDPKAEPVLPPGLFPPTFPRGLQP